MTSASGPQEKRTTWCFLASGRRDGVFDNSAFVLARDGARQSFEHFHRGKRKGKGNGTTELRSFCSVVFFWWWSSWSGLVRSSQAGLGFFIYTNCVTPPLFGELRLLGRPRSDGGLVNGRWGDCFHVYIPYSGGKIPLEIRYVTYAPCSVRGFSVSQPVKSRYCVLRLDLCHKESFNITNDCSPVFETAI